MIRRFAISLVIGLVGMALVLAADDPPADPGEPPVRLKKKGQPDVPPPVEKPDPKEKQPDPPRPKVEDEPPAPAEPDMDEQELLNRISRNMRTSEERLANKELGDNTRQLHRDILEDLDKLINKLNQPPSDNGGGGGAQQQQQGQQGQQGQQAQKSGGRRSGKQQMAQGQKQKGGPGGQQGQQGQRPGQGQGNSSQQQANNNPSHTGGNNPGGGANGSQEGPNKLADIYKDIWGHLPETLRQEMNAYSTQKYMQKYDDVLRQYYSTVAEKGRTKGN